MQGSLVSTTNRIGTLHERSLHAALKQWYAQPGDVFEVKVDGFIIDIVRDELLIEIQTRNLVKLRRKLARLLAHHPVRLIYPIAREKWVVRLDDDGSTVLRRRKSPKRGRIEHLFAELVNIPRFICHPNFSLEVVFVQEEEVWATAANGKPHSWRHRGWSAHDRRLIGVLDHLTLQSPADFRALLPTTLALPFTTHDAAKALGVPHMLAQRMAYCLRQMGVIEITGRRGRLFEYRVVSS